MGQPRCRLNAARLVAHMCRYGRVPLLLGVGVRSARLVFADMTTDTGEQDGEGDDRVIALTPIQLGVVLAQIVLWIVIVLILRFRARRRTN